MRNHAGKKILMVEKGKPVDKRHCPKEETGKCMNCKPNCMITTGFSGAGAFSDGKLSLSCEVGGELPSLIGEDFAQELIDYTDKIYLEFGADEHVEGVEVEGMDSHGVYDDGGLISWGPSAGTGRLLGKRFFRQA